MLTKKQYKKLSGETCPVCKASEPGDLSYNSMEHEAPFYYQSVNCHSCESSWFDKYEMTGYDGLTTGKQWKLSDYSESEVKTGHKVLALKARLIHPDGSFDNKKRWHPDVETESSKCIRTPSASFPFSKMTHCRTSKYQAQLAGLELKRVNQVIKILKEGI